jgi:ABC-type multidrug transport system fused ATPase/permease subunit
MTIEDPVGDVEVGNKTEEVTDMTVASVVSTKPFGSGVNSGNDLVWSNVNLKLLEKKGSDEVKLNILKNVWGRAEAGRTTAIMGASGAGSTYSARSIVF